MNSYIVWKAIDEQQMSLVFIAALPAIVFIGLNYFQPLSKEEQAALEAREQEIEEAMGPSMIA